MAREGLLTPRDWRAVARNWRTVLAGPLTSLRLLLGGRVMRIPTRLVTDEYGFSLAPEGWHYFRALLAEYDQNPDVALEATTFYRLFQDERVRRVRYLNDLLFLHDPDRRANPTDCKFYFGTYPWGDWGKRESQVGGKPFGYYYDLMEGQSTRDMYGYRCNPWYQPGDPYPLRIEWDKTVRLYQSLQKGYFPLLYGSIPTVILLVKRNGDMRAVRREGNHRLSILSHLGHTTLTVAVAPHSVEVIREDDVEQWIYVQRRLCSPEQALAIFNAYFELNGRERIEYLGLPALY